MRKPYWPILYRLVDKVSKQFFIEIIDRFDKTNEQPFDLRKSIDLSFFFLIVEANKEEEFYPNFPADQFYDLAKRQLRSGGYLSTERILKNLNGCGFDKDEIGQYSLLSLILIKQFINEISAEIDEPVY